LYEYEGAIAFEDSEMGLLNPEIEPPAAIHTIPHEHWQQPNLRLPKAIEEKATEIVKVRLALGLLEHSQGPYRSRFFLVPKKQPGKYRLINDVVRDETTGFLRGRNKDIVDNSLIGEVYRISR